MNNLAAAENITNPALDSGLQGMLSPTDPGMFFQKAIPSLIGFGFMVGSIIFIFMLIIGGIQWITSGQDKAGLEAAKSRVTHALIGMAVLLSTYAILSILEAFFGMDLKVVNLGVVKID